MYGNCEGVVLDKGHCTGLVLKDLPYLGVHQHPAKKLLVRDVGS